MITIENGHFSVRQICESGQCFRLTFLEEVKDEDGRVSLRYGLPAFGKYLKIDQCGQCVSLSCPEEEFESVWKSYFDLEEDYGRLISSIDPEDAYLCRAAEFGSGIRILRQDLWEMIISFIISQQNNIKRIRHCIDLICQRYGEKKADDEGNVYYAFPTPKALMDADLKELYACNLGYRSVCMGDVSLDAIRGMAYREAVAELSRLCGVGAKVANCICLFALHHTDAFPVDTHINKVLKEQYPQGFPFERYTGYGGSLQQYIFYYDLMNGKNSREDGKSDKNGII